MVKTEPNFSVPQNEIQSNAQNKRPPDDSVATPGPYSSRNNLQNGDHLSDNNNVLSFAF